MEALVLRRDHKKISSKVDNVSPGVSVIQHFFTHQNEAMLLHCVTDKALQTQAGSNGHVTIVPSPRACNLQRYQQMPAERFLVRIIALLYFDLLWWPV